MAPLHRATVLCALAAVLVSAPSTISARTSGRSVIVAADAFEPDGTPAEASTITPGSVQSHTFDVDGDEDWVKFPVTAGRQYTVYTSRLDFSVDTIIELYGTDGTTLLTFNDDYTTDVSSRVVYTATETGFYFARVIQYSGEGIGAYSLTLARAPGVYLDADQRADVLTYDTSTGNWKGQVSNGSGGFVQTAGTWSPGFTVLPANFNGDALTDFFLFNPANGQWAKMLNDGASGFTTQATGGWYAGWQRYVMDLDDDEISDLFLYDSASGAWFKCISTPTGFSYEQGYWTPNWEIYPMKLNLDTLGDMFIINRSTGQWFWVEADAAGFIYDIYGTWYPGWAIYPGDFDGDGRTDLFLYDAPSGTHYIAYATDEGFTYTVGYGWSPGWTPWVMDLDANGLADLFLYNKNTGRWFQMIGDGAGLFTAVAEGLWSPGWDFYPTDFNADGRSDLLLYDPGNGWWYQALNVGAGAFTYGNGIWSTGLQIVARPPIR